MKAFRVKTRSHLLPLLVVICAILSAPAARAQAAKPAAPAYKGPVLVTMFEGKLDTNSAKAGDPITLKVKKTLKLNNLEIPSGSRIIGKIQSVQSMAQGDGNSTLSIQFEKIEMKGNREMPIRGLIVAIGKTAISGGLGYQGIMGRDGAGSTVGLDPSLSAGHGPVDDVPPGSTLPGVALAEGLDKDQATELRGIKTDIKLDPAVMVKVELFRAAGSGS